MSEHHTFTQVYDQMQKPESGLPTILVRKGDKIVTARVEADAYREGMHRADIGGDNNNRIALEDYNLTDEHQQELAEQLAETLVLDKEMGTVAIETLVRDPATENHTEITPHHVAEHTDVPLPAESGEDAEKALKTEIQRGLRQFTYQTDNFLKMRNAGVSTEEVSHAMLRTMLRIPGPEIAHKSDDLLRAFCVGGSYSERSHVSLDRTSLFIQNAFAKYGSEIEGAESVMNDIISVIVRPELNLPTRVKDAKWNDLRTIASDRLGSHPKLRDLLTSFAAGYLTARADTPQQMQSAHREIVALRQVAEAELMAESKAS